MGNIFPKLQNVGYAFQNRTVDFKGEGLYILMPRSISGTMYFIDGTWTKADSLEDVISYTKKWGGYTGMSLKYLYEDMLEVLE